jgi:threonine dehydrogenase-like Zn-dependent dehydrogenase
MDVQAAVAFGPGEPLEIATVKLDGPKAGEVTVEVKATGICHTTNSPCRAPTRKACSRRSWAMRALASWSTSGRA